ncbi:HRDC domain-containing protein [Marinithermus hydrothermalis]|uniref:HRDC domain protein n=1 Tax=Marinithermus hydrothermalis (strain DSM 14884 / JCM 11576 / T1) TaxID=869210 RepID=F2NN66_MARHT|nr:HRDC domain-containing protein [Marinithermus hydrothermalis]AEB12805.1 HRDC domain protein [Marinithermus hydrothermalis DSM 14884]
MPQRTLGIVLASAGLVYLTLLNPWTPGWPWGLAGGLGFLVLYRRSKVRDALLAGALFFGWGVGAAFADWLDYQALKLLGLGLGFGLYGWLENAAWGLWTAAGLAGIGALVFLWEIGTAVWLALALVGAGAWFVLKGEAAPPTLPPAREALYKHLYAWRVAQARREERSSAEVLPNRLVARIVQENPQDPEALREILGEERAAYTEAIWELLKARDSSPTG